MIEIDKLINTIMPLLIIPFVLATVRVIFNIMLHIMKGDYEPITKEIKQEKSQRREIDIDKDLRKYFNYKE